jgi:hypothetical protein
MMMACGCWQGAWYSVTAPPMCTWHTWGWGYPARRHYWGEPMFLPAWWPRGDLPTP